MGTPAMKEAYLADFGPEAIRTKAATVALNTATAVKKALLAGREPTPGLKHAMLSNVSGAGSGVMAAIKKALLTGKELTPRMKQAYLVNFGPEAVKLRIKEARTRKNRYPAHDPENPA